MRVVPVRDRDRLDRQSGVAGAQVAAEGPQAAPGRLVGLERLRLVVGEQSGDQRRADRLERVDGARQPEVDVVVGRGDVLGRQQGQAVGSRHQRASAPEREHAGVVRREEVGDGVGAVAREVVAVHLVASEREAVRQRRGHRTTNHHELTAWRTAGHRTQRPTLKAWPDLISL
nr:hypothetical protein GCM10025699_60050 [Microbacterium flavescens]